MDRLSKERVVEIESGLWLSEPEEPLAIEIRLLRAALRGCRWVMGRKICGDEECDCKHGGWEDCVMFRKADEKAIEALREDR